MSDPNEPLSEQVANHDRSDTAANLEDASLFISAGSAAVASLRRERVPRVMMSGCVDLMHSGHVAAFQEASKYGDLYVCLGSDNNIELLKHKTTIPENERRFMVQSCRYVHECRISRGSGDLDWLTEVDDIQPDIFFVNEDGDRQPKRDACKRLGIKYIVGRRVPAEGLEARSSTDLKLTVATDKASRQVAQPDQRPVLVYFNGRGRADPIRFCLEAVGLDYEDVFLKSRADFQQRIGRGDLDFNQVPVLQIAEGNLAQARAIIEYLSHQYGLAPPADAPPMAKYFVEEVYQAVQDFRNANLGNIPWRLGAGQQPEDIAKDVLEKLTKWAALVEAVLVKAGPSPFLGGTSLTYGDVILFEALVFATEMLMGLDSSIAEPLAPFKKLSKHFHSVAAVPRLAAYLKSSRRRPVPVGEEATRYSKEVDAILGRN